MKFSFYLHISQLFLLVFLTSSNLFSQSENDPPLYVDEQGELVYSTDHLGNEIIDFSYSGFKGGEEEIPTVPVAIYVPWKEGDATKRIQKAINYLASKSLNQDEFRGAILLGKGKFVLKGRLSIKTSGIVLRGSGTGEDGTTIIASGLDRQTLISLAGSNKTFVAQEIHVSKQYLPVGSLTIHTDTAHGLVPGDRISIRRPVTKEWVDTLKMHEFGGETSWLGWKPQRNNIIWYREVVKTDGDIITLDAPLTTAIDPTFGGAFIQKYDNQNQIVNVGIENLNLVSEYNLDNVKDENHCWMAVTIENAENCWVRQVNFKHFAGSAVMVLESAKKVTVEDCISELPVSEMAAQRRFTFFTEGQQTLFQRCYAEYGYHDFAVGNFATGPNAFVQCESHLPISFSGTIDRWASGVLFDLVNVDGHNISLKNREADAQGAGWTAANSMLWQCSASKIECYSPPTATNYAYGTWGQFAGNGFWFEPNSHIVPRSLYYTQLSERLGKDVTDRAQFLPFQFGSTSSPTIELAKVLTELSRQTVPVLEEWIGSANERNPIPVNFEGAFIIDNVKESQTKIVRIDNPISIQNGWIVERNGIAYGQTMGIQWWRGNVRPYNVAKSGPHITRFVPGKTGVGLTDNLDTVAQIMYSNNVRAIDHHYGLWYERRRDDHERIRRSNSEVWPPFYEMPFSRTGKGTAWDGLSKYDLTKPNPWYWNRLKDFATLADEKGLILIHQNYFQHNILEAGAHYADFPWRTANNINNTGLPEPVPYAGDKRIFMAEQFYDISNENLKALHKQYIWQCLDNFKDNSNVIQLISEEYTGPLHFVEFWLDAIAEWQETTGKDAFVGLSTTKDVQDAILEDHKRSELIDIIDIKYWYYTKEGELYAPEGGKNLAPRQYQRLYKPKGANFRTVYKAVVEYKLKYPEKAVTYSSRIDQKSNWAVFMAGGSIAGIPNNLPAEFYSSAAGMTPVFAKSNQNLKLENNEKDQIIYCVEEDVKVDLKKAKYASYQAQWFDVATGETLDEKITLSGGKNHLLKSPKSVAVLWVFQN